MAVAKFGGLRSALVFGGISSLAGATVACGSSSSPLFQDDGGGTTGTPDSGGGEIDATVEPPTDGGVGFDQPDVADLPVDDSGLCTLGSASSVATDQSLDLFGNIVYYLDGGALPAGRYQVKYLDGCFKLDFAYNWTVNGGTPGTDGWFLVRNSTSDRILQPPGTGFVGTDAAAGFTNFDDCVKANQALAPLEFEFDGGKIGVWISDSIYIDNVAGTNGRNPKWALTYLETCPPNITPVPPK